MSSLNVYWKYLYSDTIQKLYGTQRQSILKPFVRMESKKGEAAFFNAINRGDAATTTALRSIEDQRANFETITTPDLADYLAMLTPHHEVVRQRTQVLPTRIHTGYTFRNQDEMAENANSQSSIVQERVASLYAQEDALIIAALRASTQSRCTSDSHVVGSVSLPAGQILGGSGEVTAYTKDVPTAIKEIFEANWYLTGPIYCMISPFTKKELIDQSGDKIQNKDFIDSSSFFTGGRLPEIQGIIHVVHPAMPDDEFVAWAKEGIVYNQAAALQVDLDTDPGKQFATVLYAREFAGACRVDDTLVVQGSITRAT